MTLVVLKVGLPGQQASAGNLLEMQISGPNHRLTEWDTLGWGQQVLWGILRHATFQVGSSSPTESPPNMNEMLSEPPQRWEATAENGP